MTIKANREATARSARLQRVMDAQELIEQYDHVSLNDIAGMPSHRIKGVINALAVLRPEVTAGLLVDTPKRAISDMDARVLATTVRAHLELVDTLHGTLGTTGFDADVRDRLERLLLTLDA